LHDTLERVRSLSEATFRFFSGFDDLEVIALVVVVLGYPPASQERWQMHFRARDSMATRMEAHNMLQKYEEIFYEAFSVSVRPFSIRSWTAARRKEPAK